jgi:hypothetical protein
MLRKAADVPNGMRRVYGRFARWRKLHTGRLPIPDSLWASAAELAREHGVFRTAKVLRLEYGKLKRLAAASKEVGPKGVRHGEAPPAFLELLTPGAGTSECLIELEGSRGKLRIQWKGVTGAELAGFSRAWWESK